MSKLDLAKNVNLVDFCKIRGIPLIDEHTSNPKLEEHDSLVFFPESKDRQWHRFSTQEGGDSISFVEWYYKVETKEAINLLLDSKAQTIDVQSRAKKEPYKYESKYEVAATDKVREYLIQERKIDPKIVDLFIDTGLIVQDQRNNIVFKWIDDGLLVGANRQGTFKTATNERSWKKIDKNSMAQRGFNIKIGSPKSIRFFESSIDLMSYMSLNKGKIKDTWFISMEGLKKSLFSHYAGIAVKELDIPPNVYYCVDNDTAGQKFAKKIENMRSPFIHIELPEKHKDWNDQLKDEKKVKERIKVGEMERTI